MENLDELEIETYLKKIGFGEDEIDFIYGLCYNERTEFL